jgi:HK97 family phage major capsid protein
MARTDLSVANGWIPEEHSSVVIRTSLANSFIESQARKEPMGSDLKSVPRFLGDEPVVVAEGATYPDAAPTLDEVVLQARKWGKILHVSEEDLNDSFVDVVTAYKSDWASLWARKFDNACLGVTAAADGTDAKPYTSVYRAVSQYNSASNRIQTAGALTFEDINDALAMVETGGYYDATQTFIAVSPKLLGALRNLKDAAGARMSIDPLSGSVTSLLGVPVYVTQGAEAVAAASSSPSGNPLLIVGNKSLLIDGVRSGIESLVSKEAEFRTDGVLIKVRARRAFAVGREAAFAVVEKTAS